MLCHVCSKSLSERRRVWTLDCGHEFHTSCLRPRRRCPICRQSISPSERRAIYDQFRRIPKDQNDSDYESDVGIWLSPEERKARLRYDSGYESQDD